MAKIDSLKNKQGEVIYPRTLTNAVYDEEGNSLGTLMLEKADKTYVDNKVKTDVPLNAKFTDTIVDISGKADKTYVDGLIGDINSALDMINGEVI